MERPAASPRRMVRSRPLSGTSREARGPACSGCSASRTLSSWRTYVAPDLPFPLDSLRLGQEPCMPLLLGQGHGLREQGTRRIVLLLCLSDAGLHDRGQAEHASPQQGTAHERGGLGEGACQQRLCLLEGVPFIEERRLPDGGFDGAFAAFGRALPHLLIALGGL